MQRNGEFDHDDKTNGTRKIESIADARYERVSKRWRWVTLAWSVVTLAGAIATAGYIGRGRLDSKADAQAVTALQNQAAAMEAKRADDDARLGRIEQKLDSLTTWIVNVVTSARKPR